ncbi:DnaJ-domain-containing protein [Neurospora tetrasperma FGSC 2509]|nr:DnaJ-domain-containing protein [Neurospora tetrasperma FGSC 2509]
MAHRRARRGQGRPGSIGIVITYKQLLARATQTPSRCLQLALQITVSKRDISFLVLALARQGGELTWLPIDAILGLSPTASTNQIRDAYKRAALKTHPDRVAADAPDRAERTRKFQLVNDAYYTLSDPIRRREYDEQRKIFGVGADYVPPSSASSSWGGSTASGGSGGMPGGFDNASDPFAEADAGAGGAGTSPAGQAFSWAWNFFTKQNQSNNDNGRAQQDREQAQNEQFADVFEEMLREEGMAEPDGTNRPTNKFWSLLGGISGAALGFIVANVPGLLAGVVAGNRLGAIRDAKGKSVYAVFQELPQDDKARLLTQLAAKVFSHTVGI